MFLNSIDPMDRYSGVVYIDPKITRIREHLFDHPIKRIQLIGIELRIKYCSQLILLMMLLMVRILGKRFMWNNPKSAAVILKYTITKYLNE